MKTELDAKAGDTGFEPGGHPDDRVFGCGGQATDSSDAVVVPDSTVSTGSCRQDRRGRLPGRCNGSDCRDGGTRGCDTGEGGRLRHAQGPGRLRRRPPSPQGPLREG